MFTLDVSSYEEVINDMKAFTCELGEVRNLVKMSMNKHIRRKHVRLKDKCYYCEQNVESISHITTHSN